MKINLNEVSYVYVIAKRWFQKSYGNTYHSCAVYIASGEGNEYKKELVGYKNFEYGYGEQYLDTAAEILEMSGIELRQIIKQNKDKFSVACTDVRGQKDL